MSRSVRTRRLPPPLRRPARRRRLLIAVAAVAAILPAAVVVVLIAYVSAVAIAVRYGVARTEGTVSGLRLQAPVRIVRDDRGIPHIRARTLHDLYFAQGYVTGSDRLFQIDVTRRYVYGRLSELLGSVTLATDERSRLFDPKALVAAQFARLDAAGRGELQAYADGVNAAARHEPTPPEYRALVAHFEPWLPQDSLACGIATIRDLTDGWDEVVVRDDIVRALGPLAITAFFPLTDPAYDTPTVGGPHAAVASLPPLAGDRFLTFAPGFATTGGGPQSDAGARGSNAFAAGANHTTTGRALLANDPHLDRSIPGIWHLLDLAAPGYHVAGATLAGTPGVILGHNERVAWGATNGSVAGPRVFREQFTTDAGSVYEAQNGVREATSRVEVFAVRFGGLRTRRYLQTRHGFVIEATGRIRHAVQWDVVERPLAALTAFDGLARARSASEAVSTLARYPGPTQNFVLADVSGRAAFALAGAIPDGPWGLRAPDGATTGVARLPLIPFARLPHVSPSRDAVVVSANNLQYGAGYPFRLSPEYSAPYRAAEIARRLQAVSRYDPVLFGGIQADTESLAERELAQRTAAALRRSAADRDEALHSAYAALASFDGHFTPQSRGATVVERLRFAAAADLVAAHLPSPLAQRYLATDARFVLLMRALRERPRGWFAHDDPDAFLVGEVRSIVQRYGQDGVATPYGEADAVAAQHPLAAFGFRMWNGPLLPGQGGRYAPAVQGARAGQSFRAVWDVGNWDAGGIDIPLGESGEPGSPHYRDLAERYARHAMTPLPFSDAAVARAARATLVLEPAP